MPSLSITAIHHPENVDLTLTFVMNRDFRKMNTWGSAPPNSNQCSCGATRTCADPSKVCNCDLNDDVWRFDEGYVTHKPDLPLTFFGAGDTGK